MPAEIWKKQLCDNLLYKHNQIQLIMIFPFRSLIQGRSFITQTPHYFFSQASTTETIYALSSGVNSAISIVRVSGSESYKVLNLIKHHYNPQSSKEVLLGHLKIKPRQMMLRSLYSKEKGLIDKCLLVYFQASRSYSGEDLFELHLHGSRAIVSAVFHELSKMNFKPARRGEFTRRAMLNGRMSLLQAQAINDLIHSELQFQRQIAMKNLMGKGAKYLQSLKKDLIVVKSLIQSFIQFEEQEVGKGLFGVAKEKSSELLKSLKQVIQSSKKLQSVKEGVRISIVGRPNVGKSTLINSLVKKDVAIVSNIPGTTRDLIESSFELKGYKIEVIDTAGVRDSTCEIEKQGIRRSKKSMQESHISLVLLDITQSLIVEVQEKIMITLNNDEENMLKVQNKLIIVNKIDTLKPHLKNKKITIKLSDGSLIVPQLAISAKSEQGTSQLMEQLGHLIEQRYSLYAKGGSDIYFTRDRYLRSLEECAGNLQNLIQQPYADLGSYLIDSAIRSVEEIIGKVDSEEILDQIFSTFCIGK